MAKAKESQQESAPGERTAEELHEARREGERETMAARGVDRLGQPVEGKKKG